MRNCTNCPDAVARIKGGAEVPQLSGCVQFYQEEGCVLVVARVSGLPAENETGFFGFHIHLGKACTGIDFSDTEGHYNPTGKMHPEHAGDMPPLIRCRGNGYLVFRTERFSVSEIIGRTVVVHNDPDDFHTQPAGNSGRKIACGVIQKWR